MKINTNNQNGFTLIEVILYSSILAIILGSIMLSSYSILTASSKLENRNEIFETNKLISAKLKWALIGANSISTPSVGASSSVLVLQNTSVSPSNLTFDSSNGVMRITTSGQSPVPISNSLVSISNLSFTRYSYSTYTGDTIRIRGVITSTDARSPASTSLDLYISTK